jgi:hypothetical protein
VISKPIPGNDIRPLFRSQLDPTARREELPVESAQSRPLVNIDGPRQTSELGLRSGSLKERAPKSVKRASYGNKFELI